MRTGQIKSGDGREVVLFFFFKDTATPEIYTLSLHDALPILNDPPVAAVFGEVMCSIYQGFGAAGLITSGARRDLLQVKDIGFPVFTGSTICSHGYCYFLHIGRSEEHTSELQ